MKITQNLILFLCLLLILAACREKESAVPKADAAVVAQEEKQDLLTEAADSERIIWQKPEEVVRVLGDLSTKTIADIGSGSGYFTFRFALKAKKVIAIDIDPAMIQIIKAFKQQLPKEIQSKIETRLALPNDPRINPQEADIITIINTIGYIEDRATYLTQIKKGLKPGGEIFILDFKAKKVSVNAPEMEYRVPLSTLEKDLENAGYDVFLSDDRTLAYQYIVRARI